MRSRYSVAMDGVQLSSVHEMLQVLDIHYENSGIQRNTARRAIGSGMYLSNPYMQSTSVTVEFELHIYGTAERQTALQNVIKWAHGSILTTSDRPGQQLHVVCDSYPAIESVMRWTDAITITFTAYALPYWEEAQPLTVTVTDDGSRVAIPGNVSEEGAKVDAQITANEALTKLTVSAGDTSISLDGISVAADDVITISHDENGHLRIMQGYNSLLDKRTGDDDLTVQSGARSTFSVTGNATCVFSVRGLWM